MWYGSRSATPGVAKSSYWRWPTGAPGLVHGIATLWLQGSLRDDTDGPIGEPEALTRAAARHLFEGGA